MKPMYAVKDIKRNGDIISKTTSGRPRRNAAIAAHILFFFFSFFLQDEVNRKQCDRERGSGLAFPANEG